LSLRYRDYLPRHSVLCGAGRWCRLCVGGTQGTDRASRHCDGHSWRRWRVGGYFPPLVMGLTYNATDHSYTVGLSLLYITATVALVFTLVLARTPARDRPVRV
jgi:hypothetical protein